MSLTNELEELRRANKNLLHRLNLKCEEFKRRVTEEKDSGFRNVAVREGFTNKDGVVSNNGRITEEKWLNQDNEPTLNSRQSKAAAARQALCTPIKAVCLNTEQSKNVTYKKTEKRDEQTNGVVIIRSPVKRLSHNSESVANGRCQYKPLQYVDQLMDEGNIRNKEPTLLKSILLTPTNKDAKKDPGHVTFEASDMDPCTEQWAARPLLGYDWIAGLLEVNSPITNKSDEYFSDINEFRRVNKEECVHDYYTLSDLQDLSADDEELDLSADTHKCVYCYRVNDRLFTSPMGPESACPICKKRRSRRHPTLEEPAYIRISIPRSTLQPPYKYKAHRRRSFDPTDSLALPSHCLAGWENAVPSSEFNVTSLDLKTSVEPKAAVSGKTNDINIDNISLYAARARSESLLNMSRSIHFQHSKAK
ncbi:migration and invasion-inhibitory protein [Bombina bombina]|uniref:migration and invasion-inhibitory protein n=1 Tax=Bombina bombina TaxID=8345 RepID=UPI00235A7FD8|nr:migration and invasion-inhibitory protein [Bombina bombina]